MTKTGDGDRPARVEDVHELALSMPHVTVYPGTGDNPIYQVGGKSFVFFRNPRPDAVDPDTGERYPDVIVFWVESQADKLALVQDETSPFFTTPHFDGHASVLLRAARIGELTRAELAEVVQDAWLSRASARRAADWLRAHPPSTPTPRRTR
ncbi:MmcQ/YjbR family DNA-binding protein [Nonomuraea fuscirosea]|uniref:MmcQ/YjbR family DNA-binding protein n=1 Tax=Nonomuraea fuscirosea TaxID=1291556 RepID=UPI00341DCDC6